MSERPSLRRQVRAVAMATAAVGCVPIDLTRLPGLGSQPAPGPSGQSGSGDAAEPLAVAPSTTPVPTATPSRDPTPVAGPEPLALRSLRTDLSLYVHLAWPPDLGTAQITRRNGDERTDLRETGHFYVDRIAGIVAASLEYEVRAGGRTFSGRIAHLPPLACAEFGFEPGPAAGGPPDCPWAISGPGRSPFAVCFRLQPVPEASASARLAWADVAARAGYLVEVGDGEARCRNQPPFSFTRTSIAFTTDRVLSLGADPGIPGFTTEPAFGALLASASLAPGPRPEFATGRTYGWRVRPVAISEDRRSASIGQGHNLPWLFEVAP